MTAVISQIPEHGKLFPTAVSDRCPSEHVLPYLPSLHVKTKCSNRISVPRIPLKKKKSLFVWVHKSGCKTCLGTAAFTMLLIFATFDLQPMEK